MNISIATGFFSCKINPVSAPVEKDGIFGKDFFRTGNAEYIESGLLSKEKLDLIHEAGFRCLEFGFEMTIGKFPQGYLEEMAKHLERQEMKVHSFHEIIYGTAARLNSIDENARNYVLNNDKEEIDRLQIFHPKVMVVHVGRFSEDRQLARKQEEKCRASLEDLGNYCRKRSITLAVENITSPRYLEYLMKLLEPFDSEDVGICLDTGHRHRIGEDLVEAVKICNDRLINVHIHDNHGKGSIDEHLVPYQGTINWGRFYGALKEIDYSGAFTYETMYRPDEQKVFNDMFKSFSRMQREYERSKPESFSI